MKIFITGQAGMIGFHSAVAFAKDGWEVKGIDNFNDYYALNFKKDRPKKIQNLPTK